jgi:formylglycine-generating enzyme required for sulfatase activity
MSSTDLSPSDRTEPPAAPAESLAQIWRAADGTPLDVHLPPVDVWARRAERLRRARRRLLILAPLAVIAALALAWLIPRQMETDQQRARRETMALAQAQWQASGPFRQVADLDAMIDIPAGPFQMGCSPADNLCYKDEQPLHKVTLGAYRIDKYEVTNGQYTACVAAGGCPPPSAVLSNEHEHYYDEPKYVDYPVVDVTWAQAATYCAWAGKRLPTEAEWEKAARGPMLGSGDARIYPWGNAATECNLANFQRCAPDTDRVGNRPAGASPYGVMDMAGNVWEWTADWFDPSYYARSPASSPAGPPAGTKHTVRGGSYGLYSRLVRVSYRYAYTVYYWNVNQGFRCVSR